MSHIDVESCIEKRITGLVEYLCSVKKFGPIRYAKYGRHYLNWTDIRITLSAI